MDRLAIIVHTACRVLRRIPNLGGSIAYLICGIGNGVILSRLAARHLGKEVNSNHDRDQQHKSDKPA